MLSPAAWRRSIRWLCREINASATPSNPRLASAVLNPSTVAGTWRPRRSARSASLRWARAAARRAVRARIGRGVDRPFDISLSHHSGLQVWAGRGPLEIPVVKARCHSGTGGCLNRTIIPAAAWIASLARHVARPPREDPNLRCDPLPGPCHVRNPRATTDAVHRRTAPARARANMIETLEEPYAQPGASGRFDRRPSRILLDEVSDVVERPGQAHRHVGECFQRRHSIDAEPGSRRASF